ncbi:MAG: alanine dehydrogenase [Pseudomonadales bacterium]|jgi:alanine dehydrogenase|nr:alanine dehydrogenase [Pseudomonadales bacterium]
MRIGVPTEIKNNEYRVGLVPAAVRELTEDGHEVFVQQGAGLGIGASDEAYAAAGATLVADAATVFAEARLIVKVKEPQAEEYARLRPEHTLFTYLHLAADPRQAEGLMRSGATAIAYETVTAPEGGLPLLRPMSEVAGRMSIQVGASCLEKEHGGAGVLLGGVPGVAPGRVAVIGGGVAGTNAAYMAAGLRADVTILDKSPRRLKELDQEFAGRVRVIHATREAIETAVRDADLVIGAVLVPGASAPHLVTREMLRSMRPGSAVVDISIDQGGCIETSRPTTHSNPTFVEEGVVHYCVTNMPGAVAQTSAYALNAVTLPFVHALAELGTEAAIAADPHLARGVNVRDGRIVHAIVAEALKGRVSAAA